jgi:hypothetical protein
VRRLLPSATWISDSQISFPFFVRPCLTGLTRSSRYDASVRQSSTAQAECVCQRRTHSTCAARGLGGTTLTLRPCAAQCCGIVMVVIGPLHMNMLHAAMDSMCYNSVEAVDCIGACDRVLFVRVPRTASCLLCHGLRARTCDPFPPRLDFTRLCAAHIRQRVRQSDAGRGGQGHKSQGHRVQLLHVSTLCDAGASVQWLRELKIVAATLYKLPRSCAGGA